MRFKIALLLILLATTLIESKRSRGRSRGSSSGGTGFWTRKKSNEGKAKTPGSQPEIKKETSQVQQSAPTGNSGRPIGWNVDNNSPVKKQNVNPAHTASAPYPQQNSGVGQPAPGGYNYGQSPAGGYNGQHAPGGYNPGYQAGGYNYGQQTPGGYHAPGGYNYGQQTPGGYNPGYQASGGYHAPGGYNYGQQTPGGYNPGYQAPGGYHAPGGYNYGQQGYNPGYHSSMGGYGGYSGGMFGNKYGGYGGYGGYGMKKSGGFFGKHAFRNVLGGLFVWYLVSGLDFVCHKYDVGESLSG
ncbi:spidroin-2-like [Tribolium madens]|uniref:spidroin-2-like n=1 Tax=Tribolium madens TaxID=41895 RepID=UPI001CF74FDF|nr:spidroin-2-like [Tribolium madens]